MRREAWTKTKLALYSWLVAMHVRKGFVTLTRWVWVVAGRGTHCELRWCGWEVVARRSSAQRTSQEVACERKDRPLVALISDELVGELNRIDARYANQAARSFPLAITVLVPEDM